MFEQLNRRFFTPDAEEPAYGYGEETENKVSPYTFGLNQGFRLTKFEWIPNGGKDGAEGEALEIIFEKISDPTVKRSYRQFPVTKGYDKSGNEVTDPKSKEYKEAFSDFNGRITHILHAFVDDAAVKAAFARPIKGFKEFCNIARSLLPGAQTPTIELDIFFQYQWSLKGDQKRAYLDMPTKRKHGAFICKSVKPVGKWTAVKVENPDDNEQYALKYVDDAGNQHPFTRNGWFMNSNFAIQQVSAEAQAAATQSNAAAGAAMNTGTPPAGAPPAAPAGPVPSSW